MFSTHRLLSRGALCAGAYRLPATFTLHMLPQLSEVACLLAFRTWWNQVFFSPLDAGREACACAVCLLPVPLGGAPLGSCFGSCDKLSWSSCFMMLMSLLWCVHLRVHAIGGGLNRLRRVQAAGSDSLYRR